MKRPSNVKVWHLVSHLGGGAGLERMHKVLYSHRNNISFFPQEYGQLETILAPDEDNEPLARSWCLLASCISLAQPQGTVEDPDAMFRRRVNLLHSEMITTGDITLEKLRNIQFLQLRPMRDSETNTCAAVPRRLNAVPDSAGMQEGNMLTKLTDEYSRAADPKP
ncbi:hypothetical protein NA56DRAFT_697434 [Hyaloscypha hepaticicola]|uniref:Uncharacterized protein n=1 Tax=Hyaloscypha hepaticicola TaxID=2082293 RepID=A0A2J6QLT8_9HELO|nr:hypothetical protein NA56DRAFT_697434 [Hyaloscypha hepaticicola]